MTVFVGKINLVGLEYNRTVIISFSWYAAIHRHITHNTFHFDETVTDILQKLYVHYYLLLLQYYYQSAEEVRVCMRMGGVA